MSERKTETVNFRFTPRMKVLLRVIAEREHRTQANLIEHLLLDYCDKNGIDVEAPLQINGVQAQAIKKQRVKNEKNRNGS